MIHRYVFWADFHLQVLSISLGQTTEKCFVCWQKINWESQTLAFQGPAIGRIELPSTYLEHILQLLCYYLPLKVRYHGSRSIWGPGPSRFGFGVQTGDPIPLSCNFCAIKCLPKCMAEAPEPHWAHFLSPQTEGPASPSSY